MSQASPIGVDIGAAIGAGGRLLWPNLGPLALFAVLGFAVNFVLQGLQTGVLEAEAVGAQLLVTLVGFVVNQLISIGWIKLALDIVDGRRISRSAITERFSLVGPFLVAGIAYGVMVTLGLIALIIPGIIVAIVFMFYGFHIVDTGSRDPFGALGRSAALTRGHRPQLFAFGVVIVLLNLLGLLVLVVGVIITSAISLLAVAHVYRQLAPAAAAGPDEMGPEPGAAM